MKRLKIGIITFHRAHNYGAVLQAYALSKKLSYKNEVEIIDYYCPKVYSTYRVIRMPGKNIFKYPKILKDDIKYFNLNKARYKNFQYFIKNKLKLTRCVKNVQDMKNITKKFDVFITGSDQVWNPNIVGQLSDMYTLNFKTESKKVAYAASIGDISVINNRKIEYMNKISQIDNISVREDDARKSLSKIINKKIDVVLDPTLLLSKEEWRDEIKDIKKENEKYILAYVVEPDENYNKIVNYLSEKTGLKVIHFEKNDENYKNIYKSAFEGGPLKFVSLIENAEYVVATSFHATVFSIIFHKKFFIMPHRKTGARVSNLLDKLKITNRIFNSLEEIKKIDYKFDTDWKKVDKILEKEREKSINWLINAIEE